MCYGNNEDGVSICRVRKEGLGIWDFAEEEEEAERGERAAEA